MSINSKIEWTETTWNPITGCTKISDGCKHCYAAVLAHRLHAMHNPRYNNEFKVTIHEDLIKMVEAGANRIGTSSGAKII